MRIGNERVHIFNTHLEAFKEKNRVEQARVVERVLAELGDPAVMFGGDFNAVPPEATKKSGYPDETTVLTSHEEDSTVEVIRGIAGLHDAFPPEKYRAAEPDFDTQFARGVGLGPEEALSLVEGVSVERRRG